jgi:hypothetical protein
MGFAVDGACCARSSRTERLASASAGSDDSSAADPARSFRNRRRLRGDVFMRFSRRHTIPLVVLKVLKVLAVLMVRH